MKLKDVANVIIDQEGGYKFILVEVCDNDGNEKFVVRAHEDCGYHRNILSGLRRSLRDGLRAHCEGGGQIRIDPHGKRIRVYDYSGDYGREDRSITVKLLKQEYPDWEIISK